MLNLNSVMLGSKKPSELVMFYTKVFRKEADWTEKNWWGWQVGSSHLSIGEHSEVGDNAKEPQRVMFNFETVEVASEFERIKALGAEVVKEPYQMGESWIATLADPDGNYFQLMTPWEAEETT